MILELLFSLFFSFIANHNTLQYHSKKEFIHSKPYERLSKDIVNKPTTHPSDRIKKFKPNLPSKNNK